MLRNVIQGLKSRGGLHQCHGILTILHTLPSARPPLPTHHDVGSTGLGKPLATNSGHDIFLATTNGSGKSC